jgi:hypothetical protein
VSPAPGNYVSAHIGVAVSLAANIAAAPTLSWQPVLVAGWPPLALLLAVELVVHSRSQDQTDTVQTQPKTTPAAEPEPETSAIDAIDSAQTAIENETETAPETNRRTSSLAAARRPRRMGNPSAEAVMWAHFEPNVRRAAHPAEPNWTKWPGPTTTVERSSPDGATPDASQPPPYSSRHRVWTVGSRANGSRPTPSSAPGARTMVRVATTSQCDRLL